MRKSLIVRIAIVIVFLGLGLLPNVQAQSDAGLVAEWHFDEGSGTILRDSSGNGNDGTIYGATWVDGKSGKALSFDGKDDYVDCGTSSTLRPIPITIMAWIKTESADETIVGKWPNNDGSGGYSIKVLPNGLVQWATVDTSASAAIYVHANKIVNDGFWHHFAVAQQGTTARMYIDGELIATGSARENFATNEPLRVGIHRRDSRFWTPFNGLIDEVRIYNRALTAEEIKAHYDEVMAPTPAVPPTQKPTVSTVSNQGLVAAWDFDEGSGAILKDSSGNGNDGTIYGATWVDGKSGKALSFDGKDDYVDCGNDASLKLTDFSIEAWVKAEGGTGSDGIISKTSATKVNYELIFANDIKCQIYDGINYHQVKTRPFQNEWYHVVCTRDSSKGSSQQLTLYVNGVQDSTSIHTVGNPQNIDVTEPVYIGFDVYQGNRYFNGFIDEVRIYNRALTAEEIKAQYETPGASAPPSSTVTSTPSSAISYPSTVEAPTATPSAEAQAKDSNLMLYGLIGAIGVVGVVIAVKVGGNVASKARERKEGKMQEQREREEISETLEEWKKEGYKIDDPELDDMMKGGKKK
jgi:hypothetical protein